MERIRTDVHPTESLAVTTYSALFLLPVSQRSGMWVGRSALLDKWDVAIALRDMGLRTPDMLLADDTSPEEAVAQLSLPIFLKHRVGSSGTGVELFNTLEALQTFVARIDAPNDWFFEKFIDGASFGCASCVGEKASRSWQPMRLSSV